MKTLTVEFREQILAAYDQQQATREEVARRFGVSLGMVKKLLQQRRRTGDIRPRHRFSGRKPKILSRHRQKLREVLATQPDLTLTQLRSMTGLSCSLSAIHHALAAMNLTYGKRHSKPSSESARN